jgi:glycosyltransferase involved in cell wall biosynthesis
MLDRLTAVILTYNEAPNIGSRLDELCWASDIVVVDNCSADDTQAIVSTCPTVRFFQRKFDSLASQWNFALKETAIKSEWVLALDADYHLSQEFINELRNLSTDEQIVAYRARFQYGINGRSIRSGIYPPKIVLFQRELGEYVQDGHAQRLSIDGKIEMLDSPIFHDDRKPLDAFFTAQQVYARLEANKIVSSKWETLNLADRIRRLRVVAPTAIFFYCLICRGGIFDGWSGIYYAFQRTVAELLLTLYLLEGDLAVGRDETAHKVAPGSSSEHLKSDHVDLAG